MRLADLAVIAPPPVQAMQARGDWMTIETELACSLPGDFKALIETYGLGSFADFLNPIHPFSENGPRFVEVCNDLLEHDREMRAEFPEYLEFPLYPEPGGILPWATTNNGDQLYWLTVGEPDLWSVVFIESRGPGRAVYPFGCVEFLIRLLSGTLDCPNFSGLGLQDFPDFLPYRTVLSVTVHFTHVDGTFDDRAGSLKNYLGLKKTMHASPAQARFQVEPSASEVTFSEIGGGYGSWMSLSYPQDEQEHFYEKIREMPKQLGWPIWRIRATDKGAWDDIGLAEQPSPPG